VAILSKESLPAQAPSPLGEGWEGGIFRSNYKFYPSLLIIILFVNGLFIPYLIVLFFEGKLTIHL
jgi:hypothetical protein